MHGRSQFPIIAGMLKFRTPVFAVCCLQALLLGSVFTAPLALAQQQTGIGCPDLQAYYPGEQPDWLGLRRALSPLMPQCLDKAEYFALLGAAQLNTGQLSPAVESLERALLLQPDHGGAQIDYAEALFRQGQLFAAIDMNRHLRGRDDLPEHLDGMLQERDQRWQDMTRHRRADIDLLLGHDSNLNRGPSTNQITLTLSGEPIDLTLSPEFQPVRGAYTQLRALGQYQRLQPEGSEQFQAELNVRLSEDSRSDISQAGFRYQRYRPQRYHSWRYGASLTHLATGGSSLFTATEVNALYQQETGADCAPFYRLTGQHQFYHQRSANLDAFEARSSAGMACNGGANALMAEFSGLYSMALDSERPGGNRKGWQSLVRWQRDLPVGLIGAQWSYTRLGDAEGYSELLEDGAPRQLMRNQWLLQYRLPLRSGGALMLNAYHQRQQSNIALFTTRDTAVEAGYRLSF